MRNAIYIRISKRCRALVWSILSPIVTWNLSRFEIRLNHFENNYQCNETFPQLVTSHNKHIGLYTMPHYSFICLNEAHSSSDCITSNDWMILNTELARIWRKRAWTNFGYGFITFWRDWGNVRKSWYYVPPQRFELCACWIQVRSFTICFQLLTLNVANYNEQPTLESFCLKSLVPIVSSSCARGQCVSHFQSHELMRLAISSLSFHLFHNFGVPSNVTAWHVTMHR